MHIDESDPGSGQFIRLNEKQNLLMVRYRSFWKRLKQREEFASITDVSAGQLPYNKGMADHFVLLQQSP